MGYFLFFSHMKGELLVEYAIECVAENSGLLELVLSNVPLQVCSVKNVLLQAKSF